MRLKRQALTDNECYQRGESLAQYLAAWPIYKRARNIAVYLPNDGEIDTGPLMDMIWRHKKTCYLPVLHGVLNNRLAFASWQPGEPLSGNRFGILEPDRMSARLDRVYALDLVFMPLVAFDAEKNRLGMGGGYYDRTFEFLRYRKVWKKPALVGLAHDFQQQPGLPVEPWDVPLQAVVTNAGIIE